MLDALYNFAATFYAMKKHSLIIFSLMATMASTVLASVQAFAQDPVSYFMEGSSFQMQWNPAFAPKKGYVNIPVVGNYQASVAGNTAFGDIVVLKNDKYKFIFNKKVPASLALANLKEMNVTSTSMRVGAVNFGSYAKDNKSFWSFDMGARLDFDASLPYGFVDFLKNGNSVKANNLGYDIQSYCEMAFSYSLPVTEKLYVGARVKGLVGLMRIGVYFHKLDIEKNSGYWSADVAGRFELSGTVPPIRKSETTGNQIFDLDALNEDIFENMKIPAGYGAGIDIGATYNLLPNLQLSASVNDLGVIFWKEENSALGIACKKLEFGSLAPEDYISGNLPDVDIEDFEFEVANSSRGTTALKTSINLGAQYGFLNNKIGLGLLYNMKFQQYRKDHNITLSANFRPLEWLHISSCYSLINNNVHAVGLGLNICPGFINLFAATDILLGKKNKNWIPLEQNNMNITFGLGIPIGKKGQRLQKARVKSLR